MAINAMVTTDDTHKRSKESIPRFLAIGVFRLGSKKQNPRLHTGQQIQPNPNINAAINSLFCCCKSNGSPLYQTEICLTTRGGGPDIKHAKPIHSSWELPKLDNYCIEMSF
eukprot:NODE_10759_length_493_cov_13.540541_g10107_i0.p1 GENE.NODE_10759_length_493_cov_13.540541_g10107_i0~~NODE_10759_length_493_cov_13.540541_g10107_i0.p1  ORF type:complete len:111 (+),score=6.84 NODE_10759_length_493_cov_13.540541_g10107_i0:75-407(+)